MISSHEEEVVASDSVASPIDQYDMNDDVAATTAAAAATVVGSDDDEATNTNSDTPVDIDGSTAVTSDATTTNELDGSDIDKVTITDDDNHSHQDSDADYTEFLEDVFMQVPPPENISWSDIIERNVQQMQQEQVENGKSDAEDENSEGEFTAFMNTLATAEDPDVVAKRAKKQAEFAGFVAFVETPDALGSTDFLPPRGDGSDDENSVEKAWEEVVSGMAPPVDAAPLLTWALSWFNPAAWHQPAEEEVMLEKKEKEVDPADECMSETDCASEVSSRSILMV